MFTWICPQCGNEVPPSQTECMRCAKAAIPPAAATSPAAAVPPAPAPAPVPVPSAYSPPAEPRSSGMRDLLVTVGVAVVLLGVGYVVWMQMDKADAVSEAPATAALEPVTSPGGKPHPLAKQIELTGFRLREPKPGRVEIKMLVVNHSAADVANLRMDVVLVAKGSDKPIASFPVTAKRLAPFSSAELTAEVKTPLRAYELPDWQFLEARTTIQSP